MPVINASIFLMTGYIVIPDDPKNLFVCYVLKVSTSVLCTTLCSIYAIQRQYALLNTVPVLRVYMDPERDMKVDFRLSRQAFTGLLAILTQERDHGWGHHLEAHIFFTGWPMECPTEW